jgi:AraC family transcriptional activator FtrA
LNESLNFLRKKWHEPITVNDLTKASALSRRGFQKAFQRHIGHSPGRELRRIRIERSKELLAGFDYNLNVVARMCGYRSLNSFWAAFRQVTGMSPGRYRSKFQQAQAGVRRMIRNLSLVFILSDRDSCSWPHKIHTSLPKLGRSRRPQLS